MTWVKLDDSFISHPKIVQLSHKSIVLHIAGLSHCAVQLTDGIISKAAMPAVLGAARVTKAAIKDLIEHGVWLDQGEHYKIHDYLKYQESRETVLNRREAATERKRRSRAESQRDYQRESHRESQAESHDTRPDPTRNSPSPQNLPSSSSRRVDTTMGDPVETVDNSVVDISNTFRRIS